MFSLIEQLAQANGKVCNRCKEYKPQSGYYVKKNGRTRGYCKECQKTMNKISRSKK